MTTRKMMDWRSGVPLSSLAGVKWMKRLLGGGGRAGMLGLLVLLFGLLPASEAMAAEADMQVSAYTWTPDPIINSGTATFSVTVNNNGPTASTGSTLTINLPDNVDYSANPQGCTYNGGVNPKTLTCPVAGLAMAQSRVLTFTVTGRPADVKSTSASIADTTPGNTDPNSGNNVLTKLITTIAGADLQFSSHTGPVTANAGDVISFSMTVRNASPDPIALIRVSNNLPAVGDFTYQSYSGTDWSCSRLVRVVTCDYNGAAIPANSNANPITITGRIITTAGTITNGVSVASIDPQTGDPNLNNNTASNVTVTVNAATDLRANKSMTGSLAGTTYLAGEAVTLRLSATNYGVRNATGVVVTDDVPTHFTIGALPPACTATGQSISCSVGALNAGVTSGNFDIPLEAAVVLVPTAGSNTASVTRTTPVTGINQSATVNYAIKPPFSHLTLTKSKTSGPILAEQTLISTIGVRNAATSTAKASGTVTVVDTLNQYPAETYVSTAAPWACTDNTANDKKLTCTHTIVGEVAIGASLPNLVITTQVAAGYTGGNLTNTVTHTNTHQHPDNDPTSTATAGTYGTNQQADLSIAKVASDNSIDTNENALSYTLTVSNAGPDTAGTVTVTDPVPMYFSGTVNGVAATTTGNVTVSGGFGAGESCTALSATVTCTLKNLANGANRVITLALTRPFASGNAFTNTATVTTPDTVDGNAGNNSAQATVQVVPIADVAVTAIAAALDPVKAGVEEQFTVNIKNWGANPAADVVVEIPVDGALAKLVASSISLTGTGGACTSGDNNLIDPGWGALKSGIRCTGFTLASNESRQVIFRVLPIYPYPDNDSGVLATDDGGITDGIYTTEARISTSTVESSAANNHDSKTVQVDNARLDLAVTKQETQGYDPDAAGPLTNQLHDPVAFGDQIIYRVTLRNNGPSQASKVQVVDVPTAPGGGYTVSYVPAVIDAGNSNFTPVNGINCVGDTPALGQVTCYLGALAGDHADSILPAGKYVAINLTFQTGGGVTPSGSLTYSNVATLSSAETLAALDSLPLNNSVTETTTVLPKTDLYVLKTVSKPVVDINEPFNYILTVGNKGTSDAIGIRVSDTLPSGFVMTGAPVVTPGTPLSTSSCTAPAVGSGGSLSCDLGTIPADAGGADAGKQVVITVPMRAAYQASAAYAFAFNTNITNTGSVAPLPNTSIDPVADNNSGSVVVQVRKNSLAGTVYADNDLGEDIDPGEGISGVTLTLSGTDSYGRTYGTGVGQTYVALTTVTGAGGVFTFDKLPPGTWKVVETQPSGYWDRFEMVGSAGGAKPADTCDGTVNCASSAAANTIGDISGANAITLPADTATAASGYVFQEYQRSQLSGYVYHDANNDGDRAAVGEVGIASLASHITLSGTAYNGVDVCTLATCTVSLDGNGQYSYTSLPPSNGDGYTLQQNAQPTGYFDGLDQQGDGVGNRVALSANRQAFGVAANANSETLTGITLTSNQGKTEHNFGELLPATLSGYVFVDVDADAARDPGETAGVTGVSMRLTGTDDVGNPVGPTVVTTGNNGGYSFSGLRPGSYRVEQVTTYAGLTHTGAQAGSKGGTINGTVRAADTPVTGATFKDVSAITLISNDAATNYNFGESGQGLAGFVYVDIDNSGTKDAGEPGISGVQITLSGLTSDGTTSVCTAIHPSPCVLITGADGAYNFINLPASNPAGYILTQQPQGNPPLSNYVDGRDSPGTLGGSAVVNDVLSGIVMNVGQFGSNYNFGEQGASVSGRVYHDKDDSDTFNGGDVGIPGVTITLSGTTSSGANVCDVIAARYPTCAVVTPADGTFTLVGLPSGTYTLTETQPVDYADRTTAGGTPAGTVTGTTIANIPLTTAGATGTGYLFGEKTGSITGFVWHDANNDGAKGAGETTGIEGVTLTLSGLTASGVDVCTTLPSCVATTAADGSYRYSGLRNAGVAGYTITETTSPAGYLDGKEAKGKLNAADCAACSIATNDSISAIPFSAASAFTDFNFGEVLGTSISGKVWHDFAHGVTPPNSVKDADEPGLGQITLSLTGNDDQGAAVNRVTQTSATGTYSFTGLRPSDATGYTVTETQPVAPNGISNFAGSTGTLVGAVNAATVGNAGAGADVISAIVLASGNQGVNYDFRENASMFVGGRVYRDLTGNGWDAADPGIAGVTITLTGGVCADGTVSCSTLTTADGSYSFHGLRAGTYSLTETHPVIYADFNETAGTIGGLANGVVDNTAYDFSDAHNRITGITLGAGNQGTDYNFGELDGVLARVAGRVWINTNTGGTRAVFDPGDSPLNGWTVELVHGGNVVATGRTAADGSYSITTVTPNHDYSVRFRNPANGLTWGYPTVNGGVGTVNTTTAAIEGITVPSNGSITGLDLPIDPAGVVYDAISRAPVAGAVVTIDCPGCVGFDANDVIGDSVTQTTGADGIYQFFLKPGAPSGTYTLSVLVPPGYVPGLSAIIPPCTNSLTIANLPNPALVQDDANAPTLAAALHAPAACPATTGAGGFILGSTSTLYYTSMLISTVAPASGNLINNHIPIDPILGGAINMSKATPLINVAKGDLVPYTITATNTLAATLPNINLQDLIPPGFKYQAGTAKLNGIAAEPVLSGRQLTWAGMTFTPNEVKSIRMLLAVGAGVGEGEYTNQVWALNNIVNSLVSNVATATVRVVPDPTFDCSDLIGKVFDDQNANGYQDEGEPGIPNVRVATARGLLVTTDKDGRFHVACAAIPQAQRGSNFFMKLDERSLPSGYRITTENPREVRATRGKLVKLNFGAAIHRVVRLELSDAAFVADKAVPTEALAKALDSLPKTLRAKPSVVRLAYQTGSEAADLVKERLRQVRERIEQRWKAQGCCYTLIFEEETFTRAGGKKGGAK